MKLHKFFSRNCLLCQQQLLADEWICNHCQQHLPRIKKACTVCAIKLDNHGICGSCLNNRFYFDHAVVSFEYKQPISKMIYQFKYKRQFYAFRPLTEELIAQIRHSKQPLPEVIIPVPLHVRRLRKRGFNQSAVIANALAKALDIPCNAKSLIRHKFSQPQVELSAKQREKAVKNAFSLKTALKAEHVALVDDVITTSSTVNQATKALKISGVKRVTVWALARNT